MSDQNQSENKWDEDFYRRNKEGYLHDWVECLGALVGWPEDEVHRWSRKWEYGLDGLDDGGFYHEAPMYYVTPLLSPPALRTKVPCDGWRRLQERLFVAIGHPNSFPPCGDELGDAETFDWQAAKRRVEAVLNEYGESLETIQYPFMVERPTS